MGFTRSYLVSLFLYIFIVNEIRQPAVSGPSRICLSAMRIVCLCSAGLEDLKLFFILFD